MRGKVSGTLEIVYSSRCWYHRRELLVMHFFQGIFNHVEQNVDRRNASWVARVAAPLSNHSESRRREKRRSLEKDSKDST